MKITEAFAKKLAVSEAVYSSEHDGDNLPELKKIAIARVLANTSEFLKESFENSVGTQLANMKTFKKFCLDLTTVALPNLIANDLTIVYPMKSRTGFIQYLQFKAGSNKGGVSQGQTFNDVFALGDMDESRVAYTSAAVTDAATAGAAFTAAWTPIVTKQFVNPTDKVAYDAKIVKTDYDETAKTTTVTTDYADFTNNVIAAEKFPAATAGHTVTYKVAYLYDNVVIPQNDIPTINAEMQGIALTAKARRVQIYYSQMAAFQAKTEMGIDLGEILATQACGELSYEIDTEVVNLLVNTAIEKRDYKDLVFNKALPYGVNKRDHYAGFAELIEIGSQHIYDLTKKHAANYMLCASNVKPILALIDGWTPNKSAKINGPYFAGTLGNIKVYVSPAIPAGRFVLGYNGNDMVTSAAVFAPYMAVVPTQLLGFADGSMNQGFSTMYDLVLLNDLLLAAGQVVSKAYVVNTKEQA